MSVIAPELDFETHDGFLHAVLGLLSASREIESLAGPTAAVGRPAGEGGHVPEEGGAEDAVLLAILGILSLGGRVQRIAETWAEGPPPADRSPPANVAVRPVADILR